MSCIMNLYIILNMTIIVLCNYLYSKILLLLFFSALDVYGALTYDYNNKIIILQVVRSLRSPTTCNCPVYFIIVISDV